MYEGTNMTVQAKRIGTRAQVERALDAVVDQAGGEAALAAMNLTTGEEIARNAERSMPTASVFKLPLLVEVFRQAKCLTGFNLYVDDCVQTSFRHSRHAAYDAR